MPRCRQNDRQPCVSSRIGQLQAGNCGGFTDRGAFHVGRLIVKPGHLAAERLCDGAVIEGGQNHIETQGILDGLLSRDVGICIAVKGFQAGFGKLSAVGAQHGKDRHAIRRKALKCIHHAFARIDGAHPPFAASRSL